MNTLDRYLYRTVLLYTLMAMCVLLTLGALFVFISEQSDIGTGDYGTADAFLYTFLKLPEQIFELLPIGAMIGALMGLGNLAAGSELVVTRASGVSVWRIAWPVGLGPHLGVDHVRGGRIRRAAACAVREREKTTSKLADVSFAGSSSAWVKDGNLILRVQTGEVDQSFGGVSLFQLDGPTKLRSIQRADRISVADPHHWRMHNVATTLFSDDDVGQQHGRGGHDPIDRQLRTFWRWRRPTPIFSRCAASPRTSTTFKSNHLDTSFYEIGYWSRIARMFAVIIVTLLALPFVFGPLRTTGAGTRTVIGVMLGVVFFLITRTVENGGQLFNV